MSFVKEASDAIKNTLVMCRDSSEFTIAKQAIIEFCTAFEMTDEEIIEALILASGNSAEEDYEIDSIIESLKQ